MSFTIEELLKRGGPCKITLWVGEDNAQANIQEPGSDGWNCVTRRNAPEALHAALMERPLFRARAKALAEGEAIGAATKASPPPLGVDAPPASTPRRVVATRKPAAPVAPIRRVIRRP